MLKYFIHHLKILVYVKRRLHSEVRFFYRRHLENPVRNTDRFGDIPNKLDLPFSKAGNYLLT